MSAEELLREGRVAEALSALQDRVRSEPADPKLRVFLFQILCVLGQWDRAITQLNVAAELDPATLLMAQTCRPALNCEALRADVFAGKRTPLIFGQPPEWIGSLLEANRLLAQGQHEAAGQLRERAFENAPATAGAIDGAAFEWIADADMRLGPVLEAIIQGKYYWVPLERIHQIRMEPPSDLRDLVWAPANVQWTNGGEAVALIPARYPGSEASDDEAILMARMTTWEQGEAGVCTGLGQRVLATDAGEYPLLEIKSIVFDNGSEPSAAPESGAGDG